MRAGIAEAIKIVREQKPEAMEHALALLQDTVLAYSLKICGHREDAEDNAQEVMVRTARYLPQFDNPMALSSWLYKVARTQCMVKRRRSKFAPEQEVPIDELIAEINPALATPPESSPEAFLLEVERAEHILEGIRSLPEQYRIVITLHDLEELETGEIARVLEASEGAIRVRLHRARKLLKEHLENLSILASQSPANPR